MAKANEGLIESIMARGKGKPDRDQIKADRKLLQSARERFKNTTAAWSDIRKEAIEDQRFYEGEQYDTQVARQASVNNQKPMIQVNQLPTFGQQVENGIRQQDMCIAVHATDEMGSEQKAKLLQGMVRHIEHISNAKEAYIWAAGINGALIPGFGFMKLTTKYCNNKNFDQDIFIEGCKDPMKILPDFDAVSPDFSDAKFWYEFEVLSKDDYRVKYSNSVLNQAMYSSWGDLSAAVGTSWLKGNSITVAKYWYKDTKITHLAVFEDGTTGFLGDFGLDIDEDGKYVVCDETKAENAPRVALTPEEQALATAKADETANPGPADQYPVVEALIPADRMAKVLRHREVVTDTVCWIITNGCEILDRGEWHDSEFPFVAVCGTDRILDGKRKIHGIIRHAKDPQKMANFLASEVIRRCDAANKSAWIAPLESIPDPQRQRWETSNRDNPAVLWYKQYDEQGRQLEKPSRGDAIEPAIQMMLLGMQQFNQSIKSTVGIYEAGVGETVGERQSGAAIETLAQKGEQNNFHFSDNLVLSIKRLGCLILRLIPKIYDTPRAIRIINPDDSAEVVKINQMFSQNGQEMMYDMTTDESYDVVIDTGPSYATRKSEESEQMLKFGGLNPQFMPLIADLIAHDMDWDVSNKIQQRIQQWQAKNGIVMPEPQEMQNLPPAAKAALAQLQGQLQTANQHVQTLAGVANQQKQLIDSQAMGHASKERIEQIKSFTELRGKEMDLLHEQATSKDKLRLEAVKVELQHTQARMGHVIDAMKLHQAATGMQQDHVIDLMQAHLAATPPPDAAPPGTKPNTPTSTPVNPPVS